MSLFNRLSHISRKRKLELFYNLMKPTPQSRTLDVGTEIAKQPDGQLQLIDSYPWKNQVSAINISPKHINMIKQRYPEVETIICDACKLPWPDKYFDIVYSNAVIEHLGCLEKQKQMADEIIRVGKRWFVTSPNRRYPFEFHLRLPFVTWLPGHLYLWVGKIISYNHVKNRYMFGIDHTGLRLTTASELKRCFANSKVIKQRVTFMAETLIVVGPDS